ncbi:PilW family protein [Dyella nitratireducens]|uniref:Pilus assembly protein PilW n=1 Tax=Dyella nitratireducens TaxID=1849580 RepID=A0ABQ1GP86_9GAMM|nr:PilW family protein [Dyella nitratireducens]GGA47002.1 pilus assembly protein PilW [Dyella nitratireducens]GLQ41525.1 pilus assembly protein PilW [Dyella nitratireducens]
MKRHCLGLSLIELMIAMALGLLVSVGIAAVFMSTSNSRQVQEQLARLQEEGRFAITQIRNDLSMAGAQYCSVTGGAAHPSAAGPYLDELRAPTVYANGSHVLMSALGDVTTQWGVAYPSAPSEPYSLPSFLTMRGYDCTVSDCKPMDPSNKRNPAGFSIPAMGKSANSRVIGASVLTVRYLNSAGGWAIMPEESAIGSTLLSHADGSVTIRLHPLPGELKAIDVKDDAPLVMLADCSSAQIFAVTGMGSSGLTSTGGNFVQPQVFQNMAAPKLFSVSRDLRTVTYYLKVVNNGDGMGNTTGALVRRVNGGLSSLEGVGEEIARGVERLDFKYGVQRPDGTVRYYTAEQVDNSTRTDCPPVPLPIRGSNDRGCLWRLVSLIEIDLLMSGQNPLHSLIPDELAYSYAADGIFTPASPTADDRKVTPLQQGFPLPVLRREFTAVVAVRNANP